MTATKESISKQYLGEPDAHVASRHLQTGVRILLIAALIATSALLLVYKPAAYLAAIPVPVLIIVLVILNFLEKRSRAAMLRHPGQTGMSQKEIQVDIETIGVTTIVKVLGLIAIGSFITAAAFFELSVLGIAATVTFLLAILVQLFYLPLFFIEAERDEREKLTGNRD